MEDPRSLGERLADEPEAELLEVAQAAVDQPRRPRRRPDRDVVPLDQPTRRPRVAASSARPQPTIPPPTTRTSSGSSTRARRGGPSGGAVERRGDPGGGGRGRAPGHRSAGPGRLIRHRTRPCRRSGSGSGAASGRRRPGLGGRRRQRRRPRGRPRRRAPPTRSASRRPGAGRRVARQPRSASAGSRSGRPGPGRPAPCRAGQQAGLGRWNVIVRSARTAGSDGSPLVRSMAVGRVDREDRDDRRAGPIDELDRRADRLAERSPDAGPEQRVDDDGRLLDPVAEQRDVARDRRVDDRDPFVARRSDPSSCRVGRRRPGVGRDERDDDRRARARPGGVRRQGRHRRCCRGRTGSTIGPRPQRPVSMARARAAAATAVPACSISRRPGSRAPGPAGRRRSSPAGHRRPGGRAPPSGGAARAGPARRSSGSSAGSGGAASGVDGVGSDGHRSRSVAEVREWPVPPGSDRRCGPGSVRPALGVLRNARIGRYDAVRVPAGRVATGGHEGDDGIDRQVRVALGRRRAQSSTTMSVVPTRWPRRRSSPSLIACSQTSAVDPPTIRSDARLDLERRGALQGHGSFSGTETSGDGRAWAWASAWAPPPARAAPHRSPRSAPAWPVPLAPTIATMTRATTTAMRRLIRRFG